MENLPKPAAILSAIITAILGIAWGLAEFDLISIEPAIFEPILTVFTAITVIASVFAFSVNKSDTEPEKQPIAQLADIVRHNWIEGYLIESLKDAQFDTHIKDNPDYVQVRYRIEGSDEPLQATPDALYRKFQQSSQKMLILGAPGSGKTILLLRLTQHLLKEATPEEGKTTYKGVPVVFNLSSWAVEQKQFDLWLIDELKRNYGTSEKYSRELIKNNQLVYMLDGLDEVAEDHRDACVDAINAFLTMERRVVICSRLAEYQALSEKLKIRGAVMVQPLSEAEFDTILAENIKDKATLTKILTTFKEDPAVFQEVNKPLFINILASTYKDGLTFAAQATRETPEERIYQMVIESYVEQQLRDAKEIKTKGGTPQINRTLAWIGTNLERLEQSQFYIEILQSNWLNQQPVIRTYAILNYLFIGVTVGIFSGIMFGQYAESIHGTRYGIIFAISCSISAGLTTSILGSDQINIERQFQFNFLRAFIHTIFNNSQNSKLSREASNTIGMVVMALLMIVYLSSFIVEPATSTDLSAIVLGTLFGSMIFSLIIMMRLGFRRGLSTTNIVAQRTKLNQGFADTALVGLTVGLGIGSLFILGGGYYLGVVIGLLVGFGDNIKHTILRIMLRNQKLAPFRLDYLLEDAINARLMRRVGGSAMFIHRYIQEYYADLWQREYAEQYK